MSDPIRDAEQSQRKAELPDFDVGDHVSVAVLIREAPPKDAKDKSERVRVQNFIGDVIAIQGSGVGRSFTVRRVVQGEGVERVFPFHSPLLQGVKCLRKGDVRRAKLYDLRTKSGKAARIPERAHSKGAARKTARSGKAAPVRDAEEQPAATPPAPDSTES